MRKGWTLIKCSIKKNFTPFCGRIIDSMHPCYLSPTPQLTLGLSLASKNVDVSDTSIYIVSLYTQMLQHETIQYLIKGVTLSFSKN